MAIHIHSLFCLLALILELESEPSMGSQLSDHALDSKSWEDSVINMLTQHPRGDCAETLHCKVHMHIVQYGFIIKDGVLAMAGIFLGWRQMTKSQEMQLIMSDLMSHIRAFAHLMCNGQARMETGLLASLELLVAHSKFYIFRHSDKLAKHLDGMFGGALLSFFDMRMYDVHDIFWIHIGVADIIVLFWNK